MFLRRTLQIGPKLKPIFRDRILIRSLHNGNMRTIFNIPKIKANILAKIENKIIKLDNGDKTEVRSFAIGIFTCFYIGIVYNIFETTKNIGFFAYFGSISICFIFTNIAWRIFWPLEICRISYNLFRGRSIY